MEKHRILYKSQISRIFRIASFIGILCLLINIANYCLYNDNTYTRVMFHEMYALEEVDVVFVGSSNVYRHFDPEIWDRSLEAKTFNAGTSVQAPDGAYYIMKELFKDQSPSYCIYGINYILFLELEAYNNPQNHYIIFDYLKPSINRCLYGYTVFRDKSMLNAWMPATRNANADLVSTAKDVMSIKMTSTYQKYGYDIYINSDDEEYQGRGFVYSNRQTKKGEVGKISGYIFSDYEISEKYIFYIKKLKMLCEANGCELVFVVPPLPYATMKRQENYQEILELYDKVANDLDVTIFNFDLAKPEYLNMEDSDFYDYAHMSGKGAEKFSLVASELVKKYMDGEEIDKKEYFYNSYEELLDNSPWIFNTWIEKNEDNFMAQVACGNGVQPEYCFQWSEDHGETWHMLQEYSENNQIADVDIPDECNMLMVWAKPKGVIPEETDYQQCYWMKLE